MSVRYAEIVMPMPAARFFRPSANQVVALVALLQSASWIRAVADRQSYDGGSYLDPDAVTRRLSAIDMSRPYSLSFLGGPVGTLPDWPEDDPTFLPEYCDDVKIVSTTQLATPRGDGPEMPCLHCGDDLYRALAEMIEASWRDKKRPSELKFMDDEFLYPAPASCLSCGRALAPEDLAVFSGGGYPVEEEAPFALFMIKLNAAVLPPAGVTHLDPEFIAALEQRLGVGLRSIGRYS